jgi:biopolymer transport protein ExbB
MKRLILFWLPLVLVQILAAQSAPVEMDSAAVGTIDWVAEVLKGGATSIVLLCVGFIGLVFFIERMIVVQRANFMPKGLELELRECAEGSDFSGMRAVCQQDISVLSSVGNYIASHTHVPFEILALGGADIISRSVSRQQLRNYPLAVVATLSPLLGLLGTIIGMIESFQKVALMGDTGDASVLADSIGKALITTALGLIIAIPSLASYHYFKSKINGFGIRLEETLDTLMAPWLQAEEPQQES